MSPAALPFATAAVDGEVVVPGSKSETNRVLVLAALADGPSTVTGALRSRDSELMLGALRALGVTVDERVDGTLVVTPPQHFSAPGQPIDCGLAGTVMRFVPPLALLADGPVAFTGDPHASERPMRGLLDGLRALGADVDADRLPLTVTAPSTVTGGAVEIDSRASSQFVSGLLLIGARLPDGLTLRHVGATLPSRPHIDMTVEMLRSRGVTVTEVDEVTWRVEPGPIAAQDATVEPDLTNASVFLAAAAATCGSVTVLGWPESSTQPGALFLDVATDMGASISRTGDRVTLTGMGRLVGADVDLHAASELTPVVAALAAMADGTTTIRGVGHIRGHETDRLAALRTELSALGIEVDETDDGLVITGGGPVATDRPFDTYADHRMVHTAALVALRTPGIEVTDLACVGKTMPDFPERWSALVGGR